MSEVVSIEKRRKQQVKKDRKKDIDIQASYASLERCLKFIEMNDLPELRNVKSMMRKTMHQLRKMAKNER